MELPLPNKKAKVKFHYLFGSQIETRKPIVQNELSLATAHFFTVRFGTSAPRSKSGSLYSLFVLELPLPDQIEKADLSVCSGKKFLKSRATFGFLELAFQIEERMLKWKLDSQFHMEVEIVNVTIP